MFTYLFTRQLAGDTTAAVSPLQAPSPYPTYEREKPTYTNKSNKKTNRKRKGKEKTAVPEEKLKKLTYFSPTHSYNSLQKKLTPMVERVP